MTDFNNNQKLNSIHLKPLNLNDIVKNEKTTEIAVKREDYIDNRLTE